MSETEADMSKIRYVVNIDLSEKNRSHTLMHDMVQSIGREKLNVLDVGCSGGYLGEILKAAGHSVTGVEMDSIAAQRASTVLDNIYCGTVQDFFAQNPTNKYDAILYGDVLEHIADPLEVLELTKLHLNENGRLIISVPNVTHIGVRWMLACGDWKYEDSGILDRTHLRFFTRSSLIGLMSNSGFVIEALERTMVPEEAYLDDHGFSIYAEDYRVFRLLISDDTCEDFQYVIMASVSSLTNALEKNKAWEQRVLRGHFSTLHNASAREKLGLRWDSLRSTWRELWREVLIEANARKSPLTDPRDAGITQKWRALRFLRKLGKH